MPFQADGFCSVGGESKREIESVEIESVEIESGDLITFSCFQETENGAWKRLGAEFGEEQRNRSIDV
jgi:hypothetical protein